MSEAEHDCDTCKYGDTACEECMPGYSGWKADHLAPLLDACKAALAEFKLILDEAMCDEVGERPKVKIERMLDKAIADGEKLEKSP